jgi:hypothetical protein
MAHRAVLLLDSRPHGDDDFPLNFLFRAGFAPLVPCQGRAGSNSYEGKMADITSGGARRARMARLGMVVVKLLIVAGALACVLAVALFMRLEG